jgi:hypothetical protein
MRLKTLHIYTVAALVVLLLSAGFAVGGGHPTSVAASAKQPTTLDDEDPISGQWDTTFHAQGMVVHGTFTFILDGEKITGTAYTHHTGAGTIRDGKFANGKLSFILDFKKHASITATGALKDGQLGGEFTTEGFSDKWEAKKSSIE